MDRSITIGKRPFRGHGIWNRITRSFGQKGAGDSLHLSFLYFTFASKKEIMADNYIVGEQIIKIDHSLLGVPGAGLSDIKTVYSHPQALMQCSEYLENNRQWNKISLKNTAVSAKKVKDDNDISKAAIASHISADIYGLEVLDECIQNNKNNSTRFIIVSGRKICRKDSGRISICFEIPHKSGSLYHMLSHFIYNGVNMTNIQSRPIQGRNWEYRFFIDFEGKFTDDAVQNALRGLKEETIALKILGTY